MEGILRMKQLQADHARGKREVGHLHVTETSYKTTQSQIIIEYEQSHFFFLICRRERREKNRPRESWQRESWWESKAGVV